MLWGDDCRWQGGGWTLRPVRRRVPLRDPELLLVNSYRVLLTRGRDGLLLVVPEQERLDATADALMRAGVHALATEASPSVDAAAPRNQACDAGAERTSR